MYFDLQFSLSLQDKYNRAVRMVDRHHTRLYSYLNPRRKKWIAKRDRALRQLRRERLRAVKSSKSTYVPIGIYGKKDDFYES
jgi:hypothetical protein